MRNPSPRRLLVLAYEFPPAAGGGVRRVAKLAQYLPDADWMPTVVTAETVAGRPVDPDAVADVAGVPVVRLPARHVTAAIARVLRPFKAARTRRGQVGSAPGAASAAADEGSPSRAPLSTRISRWFTVPDHAVLWQRSAAAEAVRLHREQPFDAVLAAAPPHSVALGGASVVRRTGLPLVVDMQDAWRDNPGAAWPTSWHARRSLRREGEAMSASSAVVAVSEQIAAEARDLGAARTYVMPNGFDPADVPAWAPDPGSPPTVAFMGRLYHLSDPTTFLKGLVRAQAADGGARDLRVEIVGSAAPFVLRMVEDLGLEECVTFHGFKPHAEALAIVARADLGLISIADRPGVRAIYSSKLFEYLGIGIPVLLVGPTDGVAADLIAEAKAGVAVAPDDISGVAETLERLVAAKREGRPFAVTDRAVVARFEYPSQARALGRLLDEVSGVPAESEGARSA